MKRTTVDIWGCCISRDIIGIGKDGESKYRVLNFYEGCSKITAFSEHILADISESERDEFIKITGSFGAFFKWFRADHDKTIVETLSNSESDWIIVDFRSETYDLARVFSSGDNYELLTVGAGTYKKKYFEAKGIKYDIIPASIMDFETWFVPFVDFCTGRYGKNIILIEARESLELMSKSGKVSDWPVSSSNTSEYSRILMEYRMNYEFKKRTGCHVIKCPHNVFADDCHKWGRDRVHYVGEYYDYCVRCLDIITAGENVSGQLDEAYLEICYKLMKIKYGNEMSRNNTKVRILNNLAAGNDETAFGLASKLMQQEDSSGIETIAQYYLDKKNESGLLKIKPVLKEHIENGYPELYSAYYDVLKRTGAGGDELLKIAEDGYTRGDPKLLVRYGRILSEGKITRRDAEKSIECYRKAVSLGYNTARNELFEMLWSLKNPEFDKELKDIIEPLVKKNNPNALCNYGRMYRAGRGTDKNPEKAAEYFRKSAERGYEWANIPLIDTLWEIGDDSSNKKAFDVSSALASKGNMNAKYRLGLAYEKGLGTTKDLEKAAAQYKEVSSKVPEAANRLKNLTEKQSDGIPGGV